MTSNDFHILGSRTPAPSSVDACDACEAWDALAANLFTALNPRNQNFIVLGVTTIDYIDYTFQV